MPAIIASSQRFARLANRWLGPNPTPRAHRTRSEAIWLRPLQSLLSEPLRSPGVLGAFDSVVRMNDHHRGTDPRAWRQPPRTHLDRAPATHIIDLLLRPKRSVPKEKFVQLQPALKLLPHMGVRTLFVARFLLELDRHLVNQPVSAPA